MGWNRRRLEAKILLTQIGNIFTHFEFADRLSLRIDPLFAKIGNHCHETYHHSHRETMHLVISTIGPVKPQDRPISIFPSDSVSSGPGFMTTTPVATPLQVSSATQTQPATQRWRVINRTCRSMHAHPQTDPHSAAPERSPSPGSQQTCSGQNSSEAHDRHPSRPPRRPPRAAAPS